MEKRKPVININIKKSRNVSRRGFLVAGTSILGGVFGGYKFMNNSPMEKLKEIGSLVPCDFHAHPSQNAPLENILDVLGSEGLVGLATKPHRPNFLSYDEAKELVKYDASFSEITLGHLAKFRKGYFMRAQELYAGIHHVVCFDVEGEGLPNFQSYSEAVQTIHENNGIVILSHPYLLSSGGKFITYRKAKLNEMEIVSSAYESADEVEVHNAQCLNHIVNKLALEESKNHAHIKGMGVSDAHRDLAQIKIAGVYVEKDIIESGMESIKKAVVDGDFVSYNDPDKGPYISRASFLQGHLFDRLRWGV